MYFSKSSYVINKSKQLRYIHILLSKALLFDMEISFIDEEGNATSKLSIISQHFVMIVILQEVRTTSL